MPKVQEIHRPGENWLLTILPRAEHERLLATRLERVSVCLREVLYEADGPIPYVFFPLNGVMSLIVAMKDGRAVEVATIGNEGMVGTPVFLGAEKSPTKAFAQVPGEVLRMRATFFKEEVECRKSLYDSVRRYTQAMINQISQSVACNHLHSVEQRMSRWLLITHDRVGSNEFPLTHDFLAQMLGVRRPSVSVLASILQKAGLISYHRGRITILNRTGLEDASCECYEVVKKEYERLLG
jgi:CRP-like cAMP-binding protein